jgi:diamine N-acetyltransferase
MLKGKKVLLRQLEEEDAIRLLNWENDPNNWRVSGTEAPYSLHEIQQYIATASNVRANGQLRFMIVDKNSFDPIGTVDLFDIDFKNRRTQIGVLIAALENRSKGYASEALDLIMYYAQIQLNLRNFSCAIHADNEESIRLFESKGFEQVGCRKDWYVSRNEWLDELLFQKIIGK